MKFILLLLLILLQAEFVSLNAQEMQSRYKIPSEIRLQKLERLETNAKFLLIESGVFGVMGMGCLAAGIVKANTSPDYSANFSKEQKQQYAERWDKTGKALIGLGAGFAAASIVFGALGIKCVYEIKTRKPMYKLKLDFGLDENPGAAAKLKF